MRRSPLRALRSDGRTEEEKSKADTAATTVFCPKRNGRLAGCLDAVPVWRAASGRCGPIVSHPVSPLLPSHLAPSSPPRLLASSSPPPPRLLSPPRLAPHLAPVPLSPPSLAHPHIRSAGESCSVRRIRLSRPIRSQTPYLARSESRAQPRPLLRRAPSRLHPVPATVRPQRSRLQAVLSGCPSARLFPLPCAAPPGALAATTRPRPTPPQRASSRLASSSSSLHRSSSPSPHPLVRFPLSFAFPSRRRFAASAVTAQRESNRFANATAGTPTTTNSHPADPPPLAASARLHPSGFDNAPSLRTDPEIYPLPRTTLVSRFLAVPDRSHCLTIPDGFSRSTTRTAVPIDGVTSRRAFLLFALPRVCCRHSISRLCSRHVRSSSSNKDTARDSSDSQRLSASGTRISRDTLCLSVFSSSFLFFRFVSSHIIPCAPIPAPNNNTAR